MGSSNGWAQASDMQKFMPVPMWADTYKRELVQKGLWTQGRNHTVYLFCSLVIRVYSWQKCLSSKSVRGPIAPSALGLVLFVDKSG